MEGPRSTVQQMLMCVSLGYRLLGKKQEPPVAFNYFARGKESWSVEMLEAFERS